MMRYLLLKYTEPIPVMYKDGVNMLNVIADYIDTYGDYFVGLADSFEEGINALEDWYVMFGDRDLCRDIPTLNHLENCYKLELDTNI